MFSVVTESIVDKVILFVMLCSGLTNLERTGDSSLINNNQGKRYALVNHTVQ